MPFDPALPLQDSEIVSVVLRNQFNGLKELIDAIPAGPPGPEGPSGSQGPQGIQGPSGEVTLSQLNDAISAMTANSSANTNSVATLDTPMVDPDSEILRQKMNEIILTLRR